jgi:hypothetical protein
MKNICIGVGSVIFTCFFGFLLVSSGISAYRGEVVAILDGKRCYKPLGQWTEVCVEDDYQMTRKKCTLIAQCKINAAGHMKTKEFKYDLDHQPTSLYFARGAFYPSIEDACPTPTGSWIDKCAHSAGQLAEKTIQGHQCRLNTVCFSSHDELEKEVSFSYQPGSKIKLGVNNTGELFQE